ncbi:MAG: hypothetical protein M3373_07280 [Gemmatimonadota bacterium]|nr:hypothetical protein [Gemmatimonadota bacterium]
MRTPIADAQRLEHARYHPSPDLEQYVEHFWAVRWDLHGLPPHRAEALPHPSVHLVFERWVGGRIMGVARGKFSTMLEGSGGVFAAKFTPGGFYPFVRTPIVTFTNSRASLSSIWGPAGEGLEQAVLGESEDASRIAIVEEFLRRQGPGPDET